MPPFDREEQNQVSREIDKWNNGKLFVRNQMMNEIRWIQEGIDRGFDLDAKTVLVFLATKLDHYSKSIL